MTSKHIHKPNSSQRLNNTMYIYTAFPLLSPTSFQQFLSYLAHVMNHEKIIFWENQQKNPDAVSLLIATFHIWNQVVFRGFKGELSKRRKKYKPTKFFKAPTAELSGHRSKCQCYMPDLHISNRFGNFFSFLSARMKCFGILKQFRIIFSLQQFN